MAGLRSSTRPLVLALTVLLAAPSPGTDAHTLPSAQVAHPSSVAPTAPGVCPWPSVTPAGALPPALPVWCSTPTTGRVTFVEGPSSWLDTFDHGLSDADMGSGYRTFENQGASVNRTQHFRHNDHWMVDVSGVDEDGQGPWNFGGAVVRPDRGFHFQNGKLVVEVDVAAGIEEYGGSAWPEVIVTTAPAPTALVDDTYAYGIFKGHWTVGCRLQPSRHPICALYDDTGRGSGSGGRAFEISHFQHEGAAQVYGGGPFTSEQDAAWRVCHGTDPDLHCRDRFRWELSRDTLTLQVNGTKYMEHRGLPSGKQLPDALVNGEVFVYLGSWIYKPEAPVTRFHWDRIAVNPERGPITAVLPNQPTNHSNHAAGHAPQADTPVATPPDPSTSHAGHGAAQVAANARANNDLPSGPLPAAAPEPAGAVTLTFDDRPGQDRPLNGPYPAGLIDWGTTGEWYHSGPFGRFETKSVSFNSGINKASFTFTAPRRLVKLDAFNGGSGPSTVQLSCADLPDKQETLAAGQLATIETGWDGTCPSVTVISSNGWDTNFDNLIVDVQ
jgi:hypothetical protein